MVKIKKLLFLLLAILSLSFKVNKVSSMNFFVDFFRDDSIDKQEPDIPDYRTEPDNPDDPDNLNNLNEILEQLKNISKEHFNNININVNIQRTQDKKKQKFNFNNKNQNSNANSNTNTTKVKFTYIKQKLKEKFNNLTNSITKWAKDNKKKIYLSIALGAYAGLNIRLTYLTFKLSRPNLWSNWQSNKTLEELYQINQMDFCQMLLQDIQQVYTTLKNPTDFVNPLTCFMYSIDQEIKLLKSYIFIINILSKIYVNKLFVYSNKIYNEAPKKIERLIFIKQTFLSWLANYKLTQARQIQLIKVNKS